MARTVPNAIPVVAIEVALPRCRMNHLATGTSVRRLPPGPPPSPTHPDMANSRYRSQIWCVKNRPTKLPPATNPANIPSHLGPNLSIVVPIRGAVNPLRTRRNVIANDRDPKLQPVEALIGTMKKEKITGFSGEVAMLMASPAATTTHP